MLLCLDCAVYKKKVCVCSGNVSGNVRRDVRRDVRGNVRGMSGGCPVELGRFHETALSHIHQGLGP